MMETWKQAFSLAMFEVKASRKNFVTLLFFLAVFGFAFTGVFSEVGEKLFFFYDLLFLMFFSIAPTWIKAKEFQYQKLGDERWGTPYFNFLHQLAIPNHVLIRSRFVNYLIISIPLHLAVFMIMFFFTNSNDMLPIGNFIAFSLIWFCFGIYGGLLYPASDTGDVISNLKLTIYFIIIVVGFIGSLLLTFLLTGRGIVQWTVVAATHWPLLSSVISIFLAIVGLNVWLSYAAKNMKKIDYLK